MAGAEAAQDTPHDTAPPPKGPGGRPRLKDDAKRSERVNLRLTIAERIELSQKARAAGMDVAPYAREQALGRPVVVRKGKSDARLVHEVNAIGVNLHQYIRDDRFGRGHRSKADWDRLYDRLGQVLDRLVEELEL